MQLLRSAIAGMDSNEQAERRRLTSLYQSVKAWDQNRAALLERHLKVVEKIVDGLDVRVKSGHAYAIALESLMSFRIKQIEQYCKNGVNDSQFFLAPPALGALRPSHTLLKHLLMEQSQRQLALIARSRPLSSIRQKLAALRIEEWGEGPGEGQPVRQMKATLRYLIDFVLPQTIGEVLKACAAVALAQSGDGDFYWAVQRFVEVAGRQLARHLQIGKELILLIEAFIRREGILRVRMRTLLCEWVHVDGGSRAIQQQLNKPCEEGMLREHFSFQELLGTGQVQNLPVKQFLENLQIKPFREHEGLLLFVRNGIYDKKIQTKVILTRQKNLFFFRLQAQTPDFSFQVSRFTRIQTQGPLTLSISHYRRTLFLREQLELTFTLDFNLQSDLNEFLQSANQAGAITVPSEKN